jgi:hypothetical protein
MYKADRAYTDSSPPIAIWVSDLMSLLTLKDKAAPLFQADLEAATSILASFGTHDRACAEVLFRGAQPEGGRPVHLSRSMVAVDVSRTDVPFDTSGPLFPFGHGLRYAARKSPADVSGSHN